MKGFESSIRNRKHCAGDVAVLLSQSRKHGPLDLIGHSKYVRLQLGRIAPFHKRNGVLRERNSIPRTLPGNLGTNFIHAGLGLHEAVCHGSQGRDRHTLLIGSSQRSFSGKTCPALFSLAIQPFCLKSCRNFPRKKCYFLTGIQYARPMTKSLFLLSFVAAAAGLQAQGPSSAAAARFLGQASWGPTAASVAALQSSKLDPTTTYKNYIAAQFAIAPSAIPDVALPTGSTVAPFGPAQASFFNNAVNGPDQLRQRVAFALGQIWVVSGVKINDANQFLPYYRLLLEDASGNFQKLMTDITLNPAMGHYLDMVNNDKVPLNSTNSPNENYAREILQLFTVGTVQLNEDGTEKKDKTGAPIPMYSQDVIEGLAHVFTGWTYAPAKPGTVSTKHNPANYAYPMVPVESLHDTGGKLILSATGIPDPTTGEMVYTKSLLYQGSAEKDLAAALTEIFNNPNLPPFICKQLIQHLVTSNPTPAYVQRVVNVFKKNAKGVRGDIPSVVEAILTDTEARAGDTGTSLTSKLQEPVLYVAGLARALNIKVTDTNNLASYASGMGQNLFFPPTVFNYFLPSYQIPGTTQLGPEFQIYSPATAQVRANFANTLFYATTFGTDLTAYETAAAKDVTTLENLIDSTLLHGSMSAGLKSAVETTYAAITPTGTTAAALATAAKERAQAALYLAAVSPEYQVQK